MPRKPPSDPANPQAAPSDDTPPGPEDDSSGEEGGEGPASPRRLSADRIPRKKLSQILEDLSRDETRSHISVADLVKVMDARAFGALLLIFALPNVLPAPPGTSGILGLPLVYLSAQMMLGKLPWLPLFISARSVPRESFALMILRVTPSLAWAEKLLTPRLTILGLPLAERIIGGICFVLAVVLVLPIPFGNMLPAFAICLIALGVLERDGVWIIFGVATAFLALLIVYGVIYTMLRAAFFIIMNAF